MGSPTAKYVLVSANQSRRKNLPDEAVDVGVDLELAAADETPTAMAANPAHTAP